MNRQRFQLFIFGFGAWEVADIWAIFWAFQGRNLRCFIHVSIVFMQEWGVFYLGAGWLAMAGNGWQNQLKIKNGRVGESIVF